jgi:hypothetical protein
MVNIMEPEKISGIFGSKTRYKLIKLFVLSNDESFFVREITRIIDEQINSVRRELSNLSRIGLLLSKNKNNKLYYKINKKSEIYGGLAMIFGVVGLPKRASLVEGNSKLKAIKLNDNFNKLINLANSVVLGGVFTGHKKDPVDILCIVDNRDVKIESLRILSEIENELNTSIRFSVLTRDEYQLSLSLGNDPYVTMCRDGQKIK